MEDMRFEKDLLPPKLWGNFYDLMPKKCQEVVDDKEPYPIGIGRNQELGWFIMFSGQGPCLAWYEKESK